LEINNAFSDIDIAIPFGLILNELIGNVFKYAFKHENENRLFLSLTNNTDDCYLLVVKDNGVGIPENIDIKKTKSLGLLLAGRLTKQLHGKFQYSYKNESVFSITFKDTLQRKES